MANRTATPSAIVFVKARGVKRFPSAPERLKPGIKLTTVVRPAVSIAPETSFVASNTRWSLS